ncbi:MAG: 50S ribosomal protein L13 [Candidatus Omnitrophica bacterium]|nr:50S ribosomal protein L13 [Candidatus Omnitrophota bacterium]
MKTYMAKDTDIKQKWYIVDAKDKVLGRLATRIAIILRGKHKPEYTPHVDCGDYIVVINADKIKVTGKKLSQKEYWTYSGYQGGRREKTLEVMLKTRPEKVLSLAVKRMLSRSSLGHKVFSKLKVYAGDKHPHAAQNPEELKI